MGLPLVQSGTPCGSPNLFTSCSGCKVALGGAVVLVGRIQDENCMSLLGVYVLPAMRQVRLEQQAVARLKHISAFLDGVRDTSIQTIDKLVAGVNDGV